MGGLWPTFADANQLENALINLVINAHNVMPGGGKITIETANGYCRRGLRGALRRRQTPPYAL